LKTPNLNIRAREIISENLINTNPKEKTTWWLNPKFNYETLTLNL
jgi:hypothetical protein